MFDPYADADRDAELSILPYCAPPKRISLADWAEQNLVLGSRQPTAFPGTFRLSNSPYLRGVMEALDDPKVRMVVLEAGAQTGKTTLAYAWLARNAALDPGPAMFVYPNEDLARSNSATRIQPLFEDSPSLAGLIPKDRRDGWQLLQYKLPGGAIYGVGSNSPAQLASRPIRYLLLDETDKYPAESTRGEADAVSLAVQRVKTFWNHKILMISTPTTPDAAIHTAYLRGDQCEYEIPCPACREYFRLAWERVKWVMGDVTTAAVNCPVCHHVFQEYERRQAVQRGKWVSYRAEGEAEAGVRSFHLSGLLALWADIPGLAAKFVRVKSNSLKLRDFVNSDLAEPYIPTDSKIDVRYLQARTGNYDHGMLRWELDENHPCYGGIDVQKGYLVCTIRQYRVSDGASALVWHGYLNTWAEIEPLMDRYGVNAICVDARYRSTEVYELALAVPGIWPVVGVGGFRIPALYEQRSVDIDEGRRGQGGGRLVSVIAANSDALLDMLNDRVMAAEWAPPWEIPRGVAADPDYAKQMTAMYRYNGKWVNPRKLAEHYMDAEKLNLLASWYAGIRPAVEASPSEKEENGAVEL